MRIRWKLFWLLAIISLTPLVVLRINSHFSLRHLSQRISHRLSTYLYDEAQQRLGRLVSDHARLLASRRQTLSLAVSLEAQVAGNLLASSPPSPPAAWTLATTGGACPASGSQAAKTPAGMQAASEYFRILPDGDRAPLGIDRSRLVLRLPPEKPRPANADALVRLLPTMRRLADEVGSLAHVQLAALSNGVAVVYPAMERVSGRNDPRRSDWYRAALAGDGPVRMPPQGEPVTNRVAVAVAERIPGPNGRPAGVVALFTPLEALLASVTLPDHPDKDAVALLVTTRPNATGQPELLVKAGQVTRRQASQWHAFVTPSPLRSPDAAALASLAKSVVHGNADTLQLLYAGRVCLASLAATGPNEALLEIVPLASILSTDQAVGHDVAASLRRMYLFASLTLGIVMLALIILSLTASRAVTSPVLALTRAADQLAAGDFSVHIDHTSHDELGELGRMFNLLVPRLKAQVRLSKSLALASEIQHSLLPAAPPKIPGLDLSAVSRYCDETGGDYFDFFLNPGGRTGRLGLVVGDVTGHGLEAALLMTTARALLRPRVKGAGSPADVLTDVNRELATDVDGTGRFMTLFYLELDPTARSAVFARAGHDPAIVYDPATETFSELTAHGMPLGVTAEAVYQTGSVTGLRPGQVLLIGSDGLWEARNPAGEMFGKDRTRETMAAAATGGATAVRDALLAALDAFRGETPQEDDVTLVIVALTANDKETS